MSLIAIIDQGGGCDYTVHCGTLVEYQNEDESLQEFVNRIKEDYSEGGDLDLSVSFYQITELKAKKAETVTSWTLE